MEWVGYARWEGYALVVVVVWTVLRLVDFSSAAPAAKELCEA